MIAVFLIYGLAFFSLGLIIAIYPRRHSKFQLAKDAWLVAAFGMLHGLNEWADMFLIIQRPFETAHLQIIRSVLLPVSFVFLLLFGIKSLPGSINRKVRFGALPIILIVLWILIVLTSSQRMLMADIWARYLLAAPGIALTFYALITKEAQLKNIIVSEKIWYLKFTAYAFLFYGFFSALIVPEAGFFPANLFNYVTFKEVLVIPVQVFRTICAVVILFSMIKALRIFDWETTEALRRSRDDLEIHVKERTRELEEALGHVKVLSGFLPICASCKKIRDDKGYWNQIEKYIKDHSDAEFSHSICPECFKKLYPGIKNKEKD